MVGRALHWFAAEWFFFWQEIENGEQWVRLYSLEGTLLPPTHTVFGEFPVIVAMPSAVSVCPVMTTLHHGIATPLQQ